MLVLAWQALREQPLAAPDAATVAALAGLLAAAAIAAGTILLHGSGWKVQEQAICQRPEPSRQRGRERSFTGSERTSG